MSDKFIYRLDDEISFRKCSLFDECNTDHGDCTNFRIKEFHFCDNYFCNQEGIHFHCTKHPEIELSFLYKGIIINHNKNRANLH